MVLFAVAIALTAFVALVLAFLRVSKLQARTLALEAHQAALDRELTAARAKLAQAEAESVMLTRFARDLPHLVHELHSGAGARHIPNLLLGAVTRALEPRKALVAVRRQAVEGSLERQLRLAVAAVRPAGAIEIGSEIQIGQGEIGFAAEVQRVMDRRDFESQPPAERKRLREGTLAGWEPDVVAPMVFKESVVGVIVVEGTRPGAKDVLRVLAQAGAVSVDTQARYVEMKATASIDGLTGIFNKRYLTQRLAEELHRAREQASCLSVFIFDVDHFKRYNDKSGHVAGDRLLRELAKLVSGNVRKDAVFGRYGGEEFLIMFPGAQREQALAAAENVRYAVANYPFTLGALQPLGFVSISGGVAEGPLDGRDAASLVSAADEALYRAKAAGRNRVLPHEPRYLSEDEAQSMLDEDGSLEAARQAEYTPEPGALLSLASITPPGGLPNLAQQPGNAVFTAALATKAPAAAAVAAPPADAGEPQLVLDEDEMASRTNKQS